MYRLIETAITRGLVGSFLIEPIEPVDSSTQELIRGLMLQREDHDVVHTARDSADLSG